MKLVGIIILYKCIYRFNDQTALLFKDGDIKIFMVHSNGQVLKYQSRRNLKNTISVPNKVVFFE